MGKNWWHRWFANPRKRQRPNAARPRLERLENLIVPTVQLGPVTITPNSVFEGGSVTVSGTTTVISPVGAAQLVIDWNDGSDVQIINVSQGKDVPFSVSHTMFDDDPTGTPQDTVSVDVRLRDTGPRTLTSPDGGLYRAYDVPGLNINLGAALAANPNKSGVLSAGLENDNDNAVTIPLPGSFRFYGQTFTGVNVSENGVLSFNGQIKTGTNPSSLSPTSTGPAAIAPFWDDLRTDTSIGDRVLYRPLDLDGENGPDYLIIEWNSVPHVGNPTNQTITFQALLQLNTGFTNGDIIFNYVDTAFGTAAIDYGASATIGIRSGGLSASTQTPQTGFTNVSQFGQNLVKDGQAVRFSVQSLTINPQAGPDGFGYIAYNMPFESQINLQTAPVSPATPNGNTQLIGGAGAFDDVAANAGVLLGPADGFSMYGKRYTNVNTIGVSDNGLITFNGLNTSPNNSDLNGIPIQAAIASLWDSWTGISNVSNVFGRVIDMDGDNVGEFLVIEWSDMENKGSPSNGATWQAILELNTDALDSGDIYLNYRDTTVGSATFDAGNSATVGIKDSGIQTGPDALRLVVPGGTNNVNFSDGHAVGIFQAYTPPTVVTVVVTNVPPVLNGGPDETINEGLQLTRTITFTDASSNSPGFGDSFTYTIDFGDGTTLETGSVIKGGRSLDFAHYYADDGKYPVTISLVDDDTGKATPAKFTVTVDDVAPSITFTATDLLIKPQQLASFPLIAAFKDPGFTYLPANTVEDFTTTIDWGDGTSDSTMHFAGNPGSAGVDTTGTLGGIHLYAIPGTFTVTVTVTDDDGKSASTTVLVGVGSPHLTVFGADEGGAPRVVAFDTKIRTDDPAFSFNAYDERFRGGVRVATADFDGDTLADIVTAAGPGGGPHIKIFDGGTGRVDREFFAYNQAFTGGVYVATGDVDNDGTPDIITGAGAGGGPHIQVFSGKTGELIRSFFAFSTAFRGGVRIASADVNGDGFADIVVGAGAGGGPHVRVFSGKDGSVITEFFPYALNFTAGVNVAVGDLDGKGSVRIITGPGLGGGPHAKIYNGATGKFINEFFPYPTGLPGGVPPVTGDTVWASGLYVGVTDLDTDGAYDIVVGPGAGRVSHIKIFNGTTLALKKEYTVFDPVFLGGTFVGGN